MDQRTEPEHDTATTTAPDIVSSDVHRPRRLPPGQVHTAVDRTTGKRKWSVLHWGGLPRIDLRDWRLRLFGLVESPHEFTWEQFLALPQARVRCDIHCVTRWSRLDNVFTGPTVRTVMEHVRLKPEAHFVLAHAYGEGDWTTNLPLEAFLDEDCLFAHAHDGVPLTPEHGGPVRLVVPKLYFWKSAKWVSGIEFTARDRPGFWEKGGYHMRGDPWLQERYG